jgi:hypothetical protein
MAIDTGKWMQNAVKRPGALKRKAKRAGESTSEFAHKHDKGNSRTAKQSRLAEIFAKAR